MTTATRPVLNRDTVSGEALFILKNLRDNSKLGRSNKLAEVKTTLEPAVSLEFDAYFFFLRKFHYIAMDREAQLKEFEARVHDGAPFIFLYQQPAPYAYRANVQGFEVLPTSNYRLEDVVMK